MAVQERLLYFLHLPNVDLLYVLFHAYELCRNIFVIVVRGRLALLCIFVTVSHDDIIFSPQGYGKCENI
ncbi:MAG: hypothetical protein IJA55_00800 [Clostridia bacterium]|nr:hypothetical protein [Clostridia bacterium]